MQELLGHADVSTTMNIYAHSKREAKRTSARLLDKVVGEGVAALESNVPYEELIEVEPVSYTHLTADP